MPVYDTYPAVDENYEFPPEIKIWYQGNIPSNTDLNNLTKPGVYSVSSYSVGQTLKNVPPVNPQGSYEVIPQSTNLILQRFSGLKGFGTVGEFIRSLNTSDKTASEWVPADGSSVLLNGGTDVGTLTTPGFYYQRLTTVIPQIIGLPQGATPGTLRVERANSSATQYQGVRRWINNVGDNREWRQTFTESRNYDWIEVGAPTGGSTSSSEPSTKREVTLQRSKVRHGGVVGTANKATVGLSFDHGFSNFRDHILPVVTNLALPCAVAINTTGLNTGESAGVTISTIEEWVKQNGIEPANHARSHNDAVGEFAVRDTVVGALNIIKAGLPEFDVDLFIMPGVSGTKYDGFESGVDPEKWNSHYAGRIIMDNHAVITSAMRGWGGASQGNIVGIDRMGFDTASWAAEVERQVDRTILNKGHLEIFMHPSFIGGQITAARVTQVLEYLATKRDAGVLEVLTPSAAAWANPDSSRRFDLLAGVTPSAGVYTLTLTNELEWACGSQWMIEAPSSSNVTLGVVSDSGGLNFSRTAVSRGGKVRSMFSIPKSARVLTVTAPVGAKIIAI